MHSKEKFILSLTGAALLIKPIFAINETAIGTMTEIPLSVVILLLLLVVSIAITLHLYIKQRNTPKNSLSKNETVKQSHELILKELRHLVEDKEKKLEEKNRIIESAEISLKEQQNQIGRLKQTTESLTAQNEELKQNLLQKQEENETITREAALKEQDIEQQLKTAEQVHSTFFTYTVHEMRTPLSLILGTLSQITQNNQLDSNISTQLLSAYRNALAMQDLADQLIDSRNSGVESQHLRIARYDLLDISQQICDLFVDWIAMNKVEFKFSTQTVHMWVWIDRRKMEYSLRMLISNSLHNTYLFGKIILDIGVVKIEKKAFCSISITDEGLNETENPRRGLKQIANMAEDIGGSFEQNETYDQGGTQYTLLIPLGKQHLLDRLVEFVEPEGDLIRLNDQRKEEIAEYIQISPQKRQTGKKLLIIDDSDQIRWFLKHVFNNEYQIMEARNGEEGVRAVMNELPDMVLCDVMMPVKDGFAACKEIKSDPRTCQIPVIMLTAKVESEDVIAGIENGADDYITKPFDIEVLRSKVNNLLKRREQLKQYFTRSLLASDPHTSNENKPDNGFMDQVIKTIEKHLNDPKFEAKILADSLNVSLPTLYRKIKMYSDCSILELTRTIRLKKAAELISLQRYSIQEVSEMVGFNDTATFRKRFTEQYGVTPSFYGQNKKET